MVAFDNIFAGVKDKANIWPINTEQEYHEEKAALTEHEKAPQPTVIVHRPSMHLISGMR